MYSMSVAEGVLTLVVNVHKNAISPDWDLTRGDTFFLLAFYSKLGFMIYF